MHFNACRMLDDFAHEMDTTETKMDNVMKKMAKVLHMSNGKDKMHRSYKIVRTKFTVYILFFKYKGP